MVEAYDVVEERDVETEPCMVGADARAAKAGPYKELRTLMAQGAPLRCPQCGAPAVANQRFCPRCGYKVGAIHNGPAPAAGAWGAAFPPVDADAINGVPTPNTGPAQGRPGNPAFAQLGPPP